MSLLLNVGLKNCRVGNCACPVKVVSQQVARHSYHILLEAFFSAIDTNASKQLAGKEAG